MSIQVFSTRNERRVFFPYNVAYKFAKIVSDVTGTIVSFPEAILREDIVNTVLRNREIVLKKSPKSYRYKIRKLLDIVEKIEKTIPVIDREKELLDVIVEYVSLKLDNAERIDWNRIAHKLSKLVPVKILEVRGFSVTDGYMLNGESNEQYQGDYVEKVLIYIIRRISKLDYDNRVLKVANRRINLDNEEKLLKAMIIFLGDNGKSDLLKRYLEEKLNGEDIKIISIETFSDNIYPYVLLDLDVSKILNTSRKAILRVSYFMGLKGHGTVEANLYFDGVNVYSGVKEEFHITELVNVIKRKLSEIMRILTTFEPFLILNEKAVEKGYIVKVDDDEYKLTVSARKEIREDRVEVRVVYSKLRNSVNIQYNVTVACEDRCREGIKVGNFLKRHLVEKYKDVSTVHFGDYISVTVKPDNTNIENCLEEAEKIREVVKDLLSRYERILEEKRELKLEEEDYIYLYILDAWGKYLSDVIEEISGRRRSQIYSAVARILEKIIDYSGGEGLINKWENIIGRLLDKGYIKITQDGTIILGRKKITEIREKLRVSKEDHEHVEKVILYTLRKKLWLRFTVFLKKTGLLNPKFISKLVRLGISIPLSLLFERQGNTRIWDLLDREIKEKYLSRIDDVHVVELIISDKEIFNTLLEEFPEKLIDLVRDFLPEKLVEQVEKIPSLIGAIKYKKKKIGETIVFEIGDYYLYPATIRDIRGRKDNFFIVFRKDKKVGVGIRAPTLETAYYKALENYDKLVSIAEELAEKHPNVTARVIRGFPVNYTIYSIDTVELGRDEINHLYVSRIGLMYRIIIQEGIEVILDKLLETR